MSHPVPVPDPDPPHHGVDAVPHGVDAVPGLGDVAPRRVDAVPLEARSFQGQRAGVVTRTAANAVDFTLAVVVLAGAYAAWCAVKFLINPTQFKFPAPSFLVLLACFEAVMFVYFTTAWATTGRTFGDHQLGLRVVNAHGEQLRWPGAAVRAVFCLVLPIGLYWAALSPTNRSVQDAVLRTSVVYDWAAQRRAPHTQ
jgi:uncharacterized RDD family membrane protein YckC